MFRFTVIRKVEHAMKKLKRYIVFGRHALDRFPIKLIAVLSVKLYLLMTKLAFRQAIELAKRDMERSGGKMSWFTPDESALVDVLASLIVPSDDVSPGAQDADVVNTLERIVANSLQRKEMYSRGLYSFDEWAQWKYGAAFVNLAHESQLTLMKKIEGEYQNLYKEVSVGSKLKRKFRVLNYVRKGLFPAVVLFPTLRSDVLRAFYTSQGSWVWLGYDGAPMPEGYPDLLERRPITDDSETPAFDSSPQRLDRTRRILVCLKQVPSKDSQYTIDSSGYGVNEEDLTYEINESDLYAFEEALRLKRKVGGEVTVLSLGENRVLKSIKEGLARGADRAIHVDDAGFHNVDPFETAKTIAAAIRNETFDLVLTGVESGDLAYGQTGVLLAQLLGWPYVTIVVDVEIGEHWMKAIVKRELESNTFERVEVPLPAVLTIQTSTNALGYLKLEGILQARKKEILTLPAKELRLESGDLGKQTSRIDHGKLYLPEKKKNTVMFKGTADVVAKALIEKLKHDAKVL